MSKVGCLLCVCLVAVLLITGCSPATEVSSASSASPSQSSTKAASSSRYSAPPRQASSRKDSVSTDETGFPTYLAKQYPADALPPAIPEGLVPVTQDTLFYIEGKWDFLIGYAGDDPEGYNHILSFDFDTENGIFTYVDGFNNSDNNFVYTGEFGVRDGGILQGVVTGGYTGDPEQNERESFFFAVKVEYSAQVEHTIVVSLITAEGGAINDALYSPHPYIAYTVGKPK